MNKKVDMQYGKDRNYTDIYYNFIKNILISSKTFQLFIPS